MIKKCEIYCVFIFWFSLKKSLKPTQHILKKMKLKYGKNRVVYMVQGTMKEQIWAEADIFLIKSNTKLVVSDIDGTITK